MKNILNNRWLAAFSLLLLCANIVTLVLLWRHHMPGRRDDERQPPPPQGQVFEFVNEQLKLDSTQREAYAKLRDAHRMAQQAIQDSIHQLKDAFFALLQQPAVNDTAVEAAAKKISVQEQQMELLTFRHFQKLRAICNKEQQQKFDQIIKDVLQRMAPPRNRMGPPPPGGPGDEHPGRRPPPPPGMEKRPPPPGKEDDQFPL